MTDEHQARNITPADMGCAKGMSCQTIHALDDGRLLIVGELGQYCWVKEQGGNPGLNEAGVIISPALLDEFVAQAVMAERKSIMFLLGYHADGMGITTQASDATGDYRIEFDACGELDGALIDLERTGADKVCIKTVRRVQEQIATVVRRAQDLQRSEQGVRAHD